MSNEKKKTLITYLQMSWDDIKEFSQTIYKLHLRKVKSVQKVFIRTDNSLTNCKAYISQFTLHVVKTFE